MDPQTYVFALLAGVGIAAACGLRAFLPLAAVGLAGRLGWLQLAPTAAWMTTDLALLALGTATVLEIVGDKIPVVDHVLDTIATLIRPVAAAFGSYALFIHWPAPWGQIAAVVLGGGALLVHAAKAKLRLGSTAVSAGAANPVLSTLEDLVAFGLLAAAILAPVIVGVAVIALLVALFSRSRRRTAHTASPNPGA